jgi:Predicted membrane protein
MLAAVQAPIILMSQNREADKDRLSAEHDYEVNLKAELEIMALHEKVDLLVSIRKRSFFALAVSICWISCAAYPGTPPRNPLISLPGQKNPRFRIGNL